MAPRSKKPSKSGSAPAFWGTVRVGYWLVSAKLITVSLVAFSVWLYALFCKALALLQTRVSPHKKLDGRNSINSIINFSFFKRKAFGAHQPTRSHHFKIRKSSQPFCQVLSFLNRRAVREIFIIHFSLFTHKTKLRRIIVGVCFVLASTYLPGPLPAKYCQRKGA